jgi:iron complex transport system substrate-binding protein
VKNNRLVEVPADPLSRVGPRLAEGLQALAKAIHPELFQ